LCRSVAAKNERDAQFISDLYAEHDEVRRFEAIVDEAPSSAQSSFRDYKNGAVFVKTATI
jgi:hypothetical protein